MRTEKPKRHRWRRQICEDCGIHKCPYETEGRIRRTEYRKDIMLDGVPGVVVLYRAPVCSGQKEPITAVSMPPLVGLL